MSSAVIWRWNDVASGTQTAWTGQGQSSRGQQPPGQTVPTAFSGMEVGVDDRAAQGQAPVRA
ncbi:hypothetical protein [Streptomyces sp. NPDC093591]|uniref:hypothetical protein n=1 Tax=Streptomyces sp. NPDC093591 TaxID=3366044 RepID=UPI0038060C9C